jgi:hypothetical protein
VGLGDRTGMQSSAPAEEGAPPEAAAADVAEHVPDEREGPIAALGAEPEPEPEPDACAGKSSSIYTLAPQIM